MPGKFFRKSVNLSATTDNKAGAYGFIPIQFLDLCSHLGSNLLHRRGNQLPDLLGWNCMGNTHNILICHFILTRRCQFHFLCSLKINQILLHDQLGQYAAQMKVQKLYCYGAMADIVAEAAIKKGVRADNVYVSLDSDNPTEMAKMINSSMQSGDVLLVKASRAVSAERVIEALKKIRKK